MPDRLRQRQRLAWLAVTTGRAQSRSRASMIPTHRTPVPAMSTPSASAGHAARTAGDYADYGKEIQISDFRTDD